MTDPPRNPDTGVEPHSAVTTGTSRWQKVVGIIGLLVVLWIGNQMLGNILNPLDLAEIQEQGYETEDGGGHAPPEDAPPAEEETDTGDGDHQPPEDGP